MTGSVDIGRQLGTSVHQARALSVEGALERLFSRLFRGLVYAQIWEDPVADMAALAIRPGEDLFCIASGGCNAMSYLTAQPGSVTAVDLSPAHVALLRLKAAAAARLTAAEFYDFFGRADLARNVRVYDKVLAPVLDAETRAWWEARGLAGRRIAIFARGAYRHGLLGRFIGLAHVAARLARVDFRPLLAAPTLEAQRAYFDGRIAPVLDSRLVRAVARSRLLLFGLGIPPAQYGKLAADGGGDVMPVLRQRLRKLTCDFPISENYFAWQAFGRGYSRAEARSVPPYLEARSFPLVAAGAARVSVLNRSMTDVLADRPSASLDCYALLDAQDWMSDAQLNALWAQITRTARPGARVIFRTGGAADILPGRVAAPLLQRWAYDSAASERGLAADRSAIYGGFHLYRLRA